MLKRHSLHTFPPLSAVCLQAPAAGSVRRFGSLSGGRGRHRGPTGELVQPGGESVQQGGRLGHLYHLQRQWMWHLRRKEKEEQEEEEEEETSERQSDINESYSACHESDKHTHTQTHRNTLMPNHEESWSEIWSETVRPFLGPYTFVCVLPTRGNGRRIFHGLTFTKTHWEKTL